jgi:DNA-binding transcriptional MerR regulator
MADDARYGVEELAVLGGVTRRTVRYYVQQGLLQAPLGVGRGRHYGPEHLARLEQVKALQERGLSLDEVRDEVERPARKGRATAAASTAAPGASAWRRVELVPGVELHVEAGRRLPHAERLRELREWCARHIGKNDEP